jgi:phosphoribosylamine--glycine ligase
VLTVVGRGADLAAARESAYRGVAAIELEGGQHRSDIAERELHLGDGVQVGDQAG